MSPSRLLPDDPRLTAYALDELDPTERQALERQLAESPEAQEAVREIRKLAGLLVTELRQEPAPALTAAQRTAILAAGATPASRTAAPTPARKAPARTNRASVARFASLAAIAALVLVVACLLPPGPVGSDDPRLSRLSVEGLRGTPGTWDRDFDAVVVLDDSVKSRFNYSEDVAELSARAKSGISGSGPADNRPAGSGGGFAGGGFGGPVSGFAGLGAQSGGGGSTRGITLQAARQQDGLQQQVDYGFKAENKALKLRQPAGAVTVPPHLMMSDGEVKFTDRAPESWKVAESPRGRQKGLATDGTSSRYYYHESEDETRAKLKTSGRGDARSEAWMKEAKPASGAETLAKDRLGGLRGGRSSGGVSLEQAPQTAPQAGGLAGGGSAPANEFYFGNSAHFGTEYRRKSLQDLSEPKQDVNGQWSDLYSTLGTEAYDPIVENPVLSAYEDPLSTFSVDVDTASYANVRRFLTNHQLPPPNAVRVEELVNYFRYDYPQPDGEHPFSVNIEAGNCPWNPGNRLVRIGLKGKEIARDRRPAGNLIFLVDVSGSMQAENKLPLVKMGLNLVTEQLTETDRVGIVTYSDTAVERLPSTNGTNKGQILGTINSLQAAGSTNGSAGIQLAYRAALDNYIDGGTNRVILCTDGDFNVGVTGDDELVKLIQERARTKVFFSVFGFGMGNLKDGKLEKLADKGNGHYAYIDGQNEARKVFVDELAATLVTIAKDVKLQVEFNPVQVEAYRLIGYENRMLATQDFNDDKKDAGDIGAGHAVTALYEVVPAGAPPRSEFGDALRYRKTVVPQEGGLARELLTVKLRYKRPEADASVMFEVPMVLPVTTAAAADPNAIETHAVILRRQQPVATANTLRQLFAVPTGNSAPVIEADESGQRLLLRGSSEQIGRIKRVLTELGEYDTTTSHDFNWSAAVAAFGMILRNSQYRGQANFDMVLELAQGAKGEDKDGRRAEFIGLVQAARALITPPAPPATSTAPLSREQAEAQASVNGKFKNLLRIVPAEGDAQGYGPFHEFGFWQGTSYAGQQNLPQGYWVYVAPNWYIWGDVEK